MMKSTASWMVALMMTAIISPVFGLAKDRSGRGDRNSTRTSSKSAREAPTRTPSETTQDNLAQLRGDLTTLSQGAKAAEDEIRALASDLQSMAVTAPNPVLVEQLATDLARALEDSELSPAESAQLAKDLSALLDSAGLSQAEVEKLLRDVETILAASGVGRSDIEAVVNDLRALAVGAGSPSSNKRARSRPSG